MKKLISALISIAMLTSLAACTKDDASSENTDALSDVETSAAVQTEAVTDRSNMKDGIPDNLDFEGKTVNILCRTGNMLEWTNEMFVESDDGDIVNSAIYHRNQAVEERLNVKLNFIEMNGTYDVMEKFLKTIRNSINAGDNDYDLIAGYRHYMPKLATEGYFLNLLELPYIDFEMPWWKGNFTSELTINGKLHFMAGDIGNSMLKCMLVMMYNKNIAQAWNIEDLYELVLDGKWTIDKASEICKKVSSDLDGDSVLTMENDLFAFTTNHVQEYFDVFDNSFTKANENNVPELTFNNEKSVSITEKFIKFFYETEGVVPFDVSSSVPYNESLNMFLNDRVLFWTHCLGYVESMRDMESDFGIIPYFKWNEAQPEYLTAIHNNFSIFSVASNCHDLQAVGAVTEALASESYKVTTPAYYEVALGQKYTRDDASSQMLDIIRNGVTFNFGTVYAAQLNNIYSTLSDLIKSHSSDFVSYYAKNESVWNTALGEIITAYTNIH